MVLPLAKTTTTLGGIGRMEPIAASRALIKVITASDPEDLEAKIQIALTRRGKENATLTDVSLSMSTGSYIYYTALLTFEIKRVVHDD